MRRKAQRLLTSMVGKIEWIIQPPLGEVAGTTFPLEGPLAASDFLNFPRGCRTQIGISKWEIEDLETSKTISWTSFKLAEAILHEFAHALQYLVNGERLEESFYRNAAYAEAGYTFTNEIFGGIFELSEVPGLWCPQDPTAKQKWFDRCCDEGDVLLDEYNFMEVPTLAEWPSRHRIELYKRNEWHIGARVTRPDPGTEVIRLPGSMIQDLFTNAFWERESSKYSARLVSTRTMPS